MVPANPSTTALAAGWLPQDPTLFAGTVADNIRLGWPDAPDEAVAAAALLLLDEPTAGLDSAREATVTAARSHGGRWT